MKKKYLYLIASSIGLLLGLVKTAYALEVTYPNLPGFIAPTIGTTLPAYIQYVFIFFIFSAAGIGIISIVFSAVKILQSFGKPETISSAQGNIFSIVLGIFLLATSFIILQTINPELVTPQATNFGSSSGVYVTNNPNLASTDFDPGYTYLGVARQVPSVKNLNISNPITIFHKCKKPNQANILVDIYTKTGLEFDATTTTIAIPCNESRGLLGVESFVWREEIPGIYFFNSDNCTGYQSPVKLANGQITELSGQIKSIKIVNGIDKGERYGFILNGKGNLTGECSIPIYRSSPGSGSDKCVGGTEFPTISTPIMGITILRYNPDAATGSLPSNQSIQLQSRNLFVTIPQTGPVSRTIQGMFLYQTSEYFNGFPTDGSVDSLMREIYDSNQVGVKGLLNTSRPAEPLECCVKNNAQVPCNGLDDPNKNDGISWYGSCLTNIVFSGNYYVVLYAKGDDGNKTCSIFKDTTYGVHISGEPFNIDKRVYNIAIIPKH